MTIKIKRITHIPAEKEWVSSFLALLDKLWVSKEGKEEDKEEDSSFSQEGRDSTAEEEDIWEVLVDAFDPEVENREPESFVFDEDGLRNQPPTDMSTISVRSIVNHRNTNIYI